MTWALPDERKGAPGGHISRDGRGALLDAGAKGKHQGGRRVEGAENVALKRANLISKSGMKLNETIWGQLQTSLIGHFFYVGCDFYLESFKGIETC